MQWIHNKHHPHRNSKHTSSCLNEYTAYLKSGDVKHTGHRSDLGSCTQAKAAKYRELQSTEEGRAFLSDNLKKHQNKQEDVDKQLVQKLITKLDSIFYQLEQKGIKGMGFCLKEGKLITVGGPTGKAVALSFGTEHSASIIESLSDQSNISAKMGETRLHTDDHRSAVRTVFAAAYKSTKGGLSVPYSKLIEGNCDVTPTGLPPGIPFQKVNKYKKWELEKIMQHAHHFRFERLKLPGTAGKPPTTSLPPAVAPVVQREASIAPPTVVPSTTTLPAGCKFIRIIKP